MTPEQMDQLDRVLATELMKYKLRCSPDCEMFPLPYCEDKNGNRFSFKPTRNPAQALGNGGEGTVVGELRKKGWFFKAHISCLSDHATAVFSNPHDPINHRGFEAVEEGWPLSEIICLAAAKALGLEVPGGEGK